MSNFADMRTINLEKGKCIAMSGSMCAADITDGGKMIFEKPFVRVGVIGASQLDSLNDVTWLVQFNITDSDQARAFGNVFNKLADKMEEDE